ncbi:bifunctional alpha/beta hydrolase/OsmC family protein [Christiangramia sediminis]|uniref:Bifunctional alpha/beta hydrolase/OsmC family protein n=1 Tax=Christiangramia sediminis TaxID=2881336 RepID=A0A9X1RVF2_9FLAO|nr:bifunctional alpha/beta hydrolase/OsmC family protein [Christiangramia sediminis]MCB7479989.1 bifunctional alpha/beta hydrolase/OsmC family protein [Christiangramia sediminis]
MQKLEVSFKNSDSKELKGVLELPTNTQPANFILFAHCFTCNKNFHAPSNISKSLASKGYGILRFDFTGLGDSEGEFEDTNFSSNVDDLLAAAEFLEREYKAPSMIIGHSLGGAAALFASKKLESVKCMVTINAPSNLSHVQKHFESSLEEIEKEGFANIKIGGRSFKIKKQFINDLKKNQDASALKDIKKSLLIMHSPQDEIVSIDHAEELYKAAWHPKSFVSLDGADHMLSTKADSEYVGTVISAWASKYIKEPKTPELETDHEVMANLGASGFTTQIIAGNHHLIADEPVKVGGSDLGPNPYELVSSGLAACTSMTIQMYARRKEWEISNVETHVSYSKKHAEDCENCENDMAKIDSFEREISIKGDLDKTQLERLMEIADKCPVHKTLSSKAQIITKLID